MSICTRFAVMAPLVLALPTVCYAEDDPKVIVTRTAETYRGMKSGQFEGATTTVTKIGTSESKSETAFNIAFTEPNKVKIEILYPHAGNWIRVSDGSNLYRYRSITNDLKQEPAGADIESLLRTTAVWDYRKLDQYADKAKLAGSERISANGGVVDCVVVEVPYQVSNQLQNVKPIPAKLWIDRENFLVLKHVVGSSSEESEGSQNVRTTNFVVARVGGEVPQTMFAFTAPKK